MKLDVELFYFRFNLIICFYLPVSNIYIYMNNITRLGWYFCENPRFNRDI